MSKTQLSDDIIAIIIREIKKLKEKNNVFNPVLRNDVFALLESQDCTVLYYPLDDKIEGFRIRKYVNERDEEFVYINTANAEDIQVFTAGHELGHLINIDKMVCEEASLLEVTKKIREDIIDRFAAELLMDREVFDKVSGSEARKYVNSNGMISGQDMVKTIVYLMDYFMVPYDAVVRRLCEINRISEESRDYLLDRKNVSNSAIEKTIKDGKYKRLKPTKLKAFGDLDKYLKKLDEADAISEKRIKKIMTVFDLEEFTEDIPEISTIQLEKDVNNE